MTTSLCPASTLRLDVKRDPSVNISRNTRKTPKCTFKSPQRKVLQLSKLLRLIVNSPFNFKLTNFQKHKNDNKVYFSPSFHTSDTAYKMCVSVRANGPGGGEGSHVSVFNYVMKGDDDDFLTWPFTGEITVEVLNQLEDSNHHARTAIFPADKDVSKRVVDGERAPIGWGWAYFISHAELDYQPDKNCQYLLNDTLVFRVSTEKCGGHQRPWLACSLD